MTSQARGRHLRLRPRRPYQIVTVTKKNGVAWPRLARRHDAVGVLARDRRRQAVAAAVGAAGSCLGAACEVHVAIVGDGSRLEDARYCNNQSLELAVFEEDLGAWLGGDRRTVCAFDRASWGCGWVVRWAAPALAPEDLSLRHALSPLAGPDSDSQMRRLGWLGDCPVHHYEHHADYYYYFPMIAFLNRIIIIKKTSKISQFIILCPHLVFKFL